MTSGRPSTPTAPRSGAAPSHANAPMTSPAAPDSAGENHTSASDEIVAAVGKASEALEYIERARGHLYTFHQLTGHADLLFGEAADALRDAGATSEGDHLQSEVVGRNVLDGRWTFQIVDEFDSLYYEFVR